MNSRRDISNQIHIINQVKKILKNYIIHFPNHSFYLGGSLGKKEAKIVLKNGSVKPLNDIDILIIQNCYSRETRIKNKYISAIKKELKEFLQLPFVDINYTNLKYLEAETLESYEFNLTGLLLFGRELRSKKENIKIPKIAEFIDYLYNRLGGIILAKIGFIKNKKEIIYQYIKTWISVGDLIVYLENDNYPPFYKERLNAFIKTKSFSESIRNNCIDSYKYKINLDVEELELNKLLNDMLIFKSILFLIKKLLLSSFKSLNLVNLLTPNKNFKKLIKLSNFLGIFIVSKNTKIKNLLNKNYCKTLKNLIKKYILFSINKWLISIGHSKINHIQLFDNE